MYRELPPSPYYGSQLLSVGFQDARLIESEYAPGQRIPEHRHERAYLCLVLRGSYFERVSGSIRRCDTGMSIFHPAGERHSDRFGRRTGRGRIFMIEPTGRWLARCGDHAIRLEERVECSGGALSTLMTRIYQEAASAEQHAPLVVEALLLEIAVWFGRTPVAGDRRPPAWLVRIRDRLREEHGSAIRLDHIAAAERVCPTILAHSFRRYFGTTAGEYLRSVRVAAACRRLRNGERNLAGIALDCGFASQSHFCATFRKSMGSSPLQYLKRFTRDCD